jgi:amidophosphoribosyltransferase
MCGIFACFTHHHAAKDKFRRIVYNAMSNIQHRGQDGYGIIVLGHSSLPTIIKRDGLLPEYSDAFQSLELDTLFLGHMRYSTNTITEKDGSTRSNSIQPIEINKSRKMYLAHNGNLPNLARNIKRLGLESYYQNGTSDTFLFKAIWDKMQAEQDQEATNEINLQILVQYMLKVVKSVGGAFSCVLSYSEESDEVATPCSDTNISNLFSSFESSASSIDRSEYGVNQDYYLFGFRDRFGYKPLSIGYMAGNYCFISETVQLKDGYKFVRDVAPGEIWMIKNNQEPTMLDAYYIVESTPKPFVCSMESIYFMKLNSLIFGGTTSVHNFRRRIGMELARADLTASSTAISSSTVITFVPESSKSIADGYASVMGKTASDGLIVKIENIRSFIENSNDSRIGKIKRKFAFNIDDIKKLKEIVLIDDSVVRGNTMRYLIQILYEINCDLRIHLRIGSPPLVKGCNFGIDLYDNELIASKIGVSNLAQYFHVASIEFLNLKKLNEIFAEFGMNNCKWCFGSGDANTTSTLEW